MSRQLKFLDPQLGKSTDTFRFYHITVLFMYDSPEDDSACSATAMEKYSSGQVLGEVASIRTTSCLAFASKALIHS